MDVLSSNPSSCENVVIIGSGCAGNTAAIYSARASLNPLVVIGHEAGGQLSITSLVENFPGFPEGVDGPQLVENMKQQAIHFGADYIHGSVEEADFSKRPFRLKVAGEWIETRTVIIAPGASARWLGIPVWRTNPEWKEVIKMNGENREAMLSTYRGNLLHVDGRFLALGEYGHLLWMDLTPKGYKEISRAWLCAARETWALPVLSRGLLYVVQNGKDTLYG